MLIKRMVKEYDSFRHFDDELKYVLELRFGSNQISESNMSRLKKLGLVIC